mgnify:CR=1 FL=1
MRTLLDWLWGFFVLGVADADADVDPDPAAADDAAGAADADADLDEGDADADAGAGDEDTDADALAAKAAEDAKALKDAQEERDRAKADLEAERRRAPPAAGLTDEQRLHEQEEAKLRDAKTTELERWQINSNRTLRENKRTSTAALAQAHDLSDKTSFNQLVITKPALHKRYAERVEAELRKMRGNGQNAPREAILRFLIGDDAMKGSLTSKKQSETKTDAGGVDRGKSPGARSDVAAKGRLTEAQKREKRLEGVQL